MLYKEKSKNGYKKWKFRKTKSCVFFLSQGSFNPKIRFLVQKVCPVASVQTDRRTHRQSDYCGHPFRISGLFPSTYYQGSAQKMFVSHVPRITQPKNQVPRSKGVLCSLVTDRQTRKWLLWAPCQGFRSFPFNLSSKIGPISLLWTKNAIQFENRKVQYVIGPILDDRLKEKILKPWKGAHSSHFRVCVSVCVCVTRLQSTSFDLGIWFLGWVILGTWEKNAFFCFSKFSFLRFL